MLFLRSTVRTHPAATLGSQSVVIVRGMGHFIIRAGLSVGLAQRISLADVWWREVCVRGREHLSAKLTGS